MICVACANNAVYLAIEANTWERIARYDPVLVQNALGAG